jgi:hypothetical protein
MKMKWLAIILSGLSAAVWLWSALLRIPVVYNLMGRAFWGAPATEQKEFLFLPVLRLQSKLNAIAASLMFLATIAQPLSF